MNDREATRFRIVTATARWWRLHGAAARSDASREGTLGYQRLRVRANGEHGEHDVGRAGPRLSLSRTVRSDVAAEAVHLVHHLPDGQIAGQPHPAGRAEGAGHRAAGLGRDAHRDSLRPLM